MVASSSGVRMEDEEPNWILPEKRSSEKYSPVRLRILLRSVWVHDLRLALSADGVRGWRGDCDVNAAVC